MQIAQTIKGKRWNSTSSSWKKINKIANIIVLIPIVSQPVRLSVFLPLSESWYSGCTLTFTSCQQKGHTKTSSLVACSLSFTSDRGVMSKTKISLECIQRSSHNSCPSNPGACCFLSIRHFIPYTCNLASHLGQCTMLNVAGSLT